MNKKIFISLFSFFVALLIVCSFAEANAFVSEDNGIEECNGHNTFRNEGNDFKYTCFVTEFNCKNRFIKTFLRSPESLNLYESSVWMPKTKERCCCYYYAQLEKEEGSNPFLESLKGGELIGNYRVYNLDENDYFGNPKDADLNKAGFVVSNIKIITAHENEIEFKGKEVKGMIKSVSYDGVIILGGSEQEALDLSIEGKNHKFLYEHYENQSIMRMDENWVKREPDVKSKGDTTIILNKEKKIVVLYSDDKIFEGHIHLNEGGELCDSSGGGIPFVTAISEIIADINQDSWMLKGLDKVNTVKVGQYTIIFKNPIKVSKIFFVGKSHIGFTLEGSDLRMVDNWGDNLTLNGKLVLGWAYKKPNPEGGYFLEDSDFKKLVRGSLIFNQEEIEGSNIRIFKDNVKFSEFIKNNIESSLLIKGGRVYISPLFTGKINGIDFKFGAPQLLSLELRKTNPNNIYTANGRRLIDLNNGVYQFSNLIPTKRMQEVGVAVAPDVSGVNIQIVDLSKKLKKEVFEEAFPEQQNDYLVEQIESPETTFLGWLIQKHYSYLGSYKPSSGAIWLAKELDIENLDFYDGVFVHETLHKIWFENPVLKVSHNKISNDLCRFLENCILYTSTRLGRESCREIYNALTEIPVYVKQAESGMDILTIEGWAWIGQAMYEAYKANNPNLKFPKFITENYKGVLKDNIIDFVSE